MSKEPFEAAFFWKDGKLIPFNHVMGDECEKHMSPGGMYIFQLVEMSESKSLSWQQMKSIHLWLSQVSDKMNDAGIDMKTVLNAMRKGFSVRPSKELLKECLWKPLQEAVLKVSSTRDLTRTDVNEIYDRLDGFLQREFKLHVPFPDRYGQSLDNIEH